MELVDCYELLARWLCACTREHNFPYSVSLHQCHRIRRGLQAPLTHCFYPNHLRNVILMSSGHCEFISCDQIHMFKYLRQKTIGSLWTFYPYSIPTHHATIKRRGNQRAKKGAEKIRCGGGLKAVLDESGDQARRLHNQLSDWIYLGQSVAKLK